MRRYIRHPANIPIEINIEKQPAATVTAHSPSLREGVGKGRDALTSYLSPSPTLPQRGDGAERLPATSTTSNVAVGGLCFQSSNNIDPGCRIQLNINIHEPFEAHGVVVWCKPNNNHFEVGVQFDDEYTKYAVRMVEQVCWIEDYRRKALEKEGRKLTTDEAAAEWISRYASRFEEMGK